VQHSAQCNNQGERSVSLTSVFDAAPRCTQNDDKNSSRSQEETGCRLQTLLSTKPMIKDTNDDNIHTKDHLGTRQLEFDELLRESFNCTLKYAAAASSQRRKPQTANTQASLQIGNFRVHSAVRAVSCLATEML
jgi:hypothetical protein